MKAVGLTAACVSAVVLTMSQPQNARASSYSQAKAAVCHYFRSNCSKAMSVVRCETGGTYSPFARNGQYLGIFQMGSHERATYGHAWNVWGQARAAYHYYLDAGWRPWACA